MIRSCLERFMPMLIAFQNYHEFLIIIVTKFDCHNRQTLTMDIHSFQWHARCFRFSFRFLFLFFPLDFFLFFRLFRNCKFLIVTKCVRFGLFFFVSMIISLVQSTMWGVINYSCLKELRNCKYFLLLLFFSLATALICNFLSEMSTSFQSHRI